ncbi:MAG TPA: glycosyltransferase family 4 protein [Blastocatellia bacterium]|nr:glycosyltransferase family 4 protein [Blastocatellia bacterium]HMV82379.1 glycosyltransferase family 4 protein [Blastocatellia bacterium]HMX28216.1 glycosyltransferase family 4 protein [Blastocatellia bacterium]HMZ21535.1 glycosyltransferase family 4 protein [Blastocatellia bacterium]HNG30366.1 glycosyltransferase family 4 protein [Blastocatellia bacterium]
MRIAQISTFHSPVRQHGSGSIEALVWLLTRELIELGHEVTVFAAAGSETDGELVTTLPGAYGENGSFDDWYLCDWVNLCEAVKASGRFDVLHSHAYLRGLPLQSFSRAPMVHTLHVCPFDDEARLWRMTPDACVTAISEYQWNAFPDLHPAAIIPHGIDATHFTPQWQPEDYVCFLGKFSERKGALLAIETAKQLNLRLLLAGPQDEDFARIQPHLDGERIKYVGYVSGAERERLLGGARALLYPIRSPEPFGLIQVEAMMCGTPVAAMRLGAVTEIIDEGVTGFAAGTEAEFAQQVLRCFALDRRRVRAQAEARFSARRMARDYAQVYQAVCSGAQAVGKAL